MSSAIHYVSEAAVVIGSDRIRRHSDPEIRSLAGKTVKVFPETAYEVFFEGKRRGKTVMIIPLEVPGDMKPRWLMAKHLQSSDRAILNLKA